jgi:hypothetical protein
VENRSRRRDMEEFENICDKAHYKAEKNKEKY